MLSMCFSIITTKVKTLRKEAAKLINTIITNISATVSIDDKAKCIEIMYELGKLYKLEQPMMMQPVEERIY